MADSLNLVKTRLAELVALPSVSCVDPALDLGNHALVERLAAWFEAAGFAVSCQQVAREPRKSNLVARLGSGSHGLVLAGHTDTVPYDAGRWHSDPFVLSEREERWYGFNALGCQSVIFGPGDIATAHQPDEYVEIANVVRMTGIVRRVIERFCCDE